MNKNKLLAALAGIILLSGCAVLQGEQTVQALNKAQPTGSEFTRYLTAEYRDFANFEWNDMMDYPDAYYYAKKGLMAARGEVVMPEDPANWRLTKAKKEELASARAGLMAEFANGSRERLPRESAIAQARFDCWVEQEEEGWQAEDIASCKNQFMNAFPALKKAMRAPAPAMDEPSYLVFFDWDKYVITPEAGRVLDTAVADVKAKRVNYVLVSGYTDTSGSKTYNQKLSERRANAVKEALTQRGLTADQIRTEAFGETRLMVQTGDGVREPSNRRGEIRFR